MECYCSSLTCLTINNLLWFAAFQFYVHNWLTPALLCVYIVNSHLSEKRRQQSVTISNLLAALGMSDPVGITSLWPFCGACHFFEWAELTKTIARNATFQGKSAPVNNRGVLALKQYLLCKRCFRYHYPQRMMESWDRLLEGRTDHDWKLI